MKRHGNLAFFVPHLGCPHACVFCDQKNISGETGTVTPEEVRDLCGRALPERGDHTEIAFFGGSFTAVDRQTMTGLLEAAAPFVREGRACGIRCSTRPDAIDRERLELLKAYGVTSVELGAQSMDDAVLQKNLRGHDSAAVERAGALIREAGFSLGLQMMVGMYGEEDPFAGAVETAQRLIALRPDTVRIYPTLVVEGTALAALYRAGRYRPLTVEQAVDITARLLRMFRAADIDVIRVGLHYEASLERSVIAGPFHPAFGELCEARIWREELERLTAGQSECRVGCEPRILSQVLGQKRENLSYLRSLGREVTVLPVKELTGIKLMQENEVVS